MSYSTQDDLLKHVTSDDLTQLTDDEGSGMVAADRVADAIADADATIDGYLARRYALPLSPVPALVNHLSVDIALYNLYCRRPGTMPEARKDRYDAALKQLTDLAKGLAVLPGASEAPPVLADQAQTTTTDSVFTAANTSLQDPWGGY